MCRIFRSHCCNYVLPTFATHEEISVDAHNPNNICPLKWFRVCCLINAGRVKIPWFRSLNSSLWSLFLSLKVNFLSLSLSLKSFVNIADWNEKSTYGNIEYPKVPWLCHALKYKFASWRLNKTLKASSELPRHAYRLVWCSLLLVLRDFDQSAHFMYSLIATFVR